MPPPAVGLRSSSTTSSSIPLSNHMAASDHHNQQQHENSNSTVFGFSTEFDNQTSRVGPTRTLPRLAKKKQLNGRSRAASARFGSGFNPFKPVSETCYDFSSCGISIDKFSEKCVSNNGSVSQLNSNVEFKFGGENECLKSENVGFVFGAKQSEPNFAFKDNGKVDDAGFVFRGNASCAEANLDPGKAASVGGLGSEFVGQGNANLKHHFDSERYGNMGFKVGLDGGNLGTNINLEMGETSGSMLKLETGNVGCMFGAAQNNVNANARVAGSCFSSSTSSFDEEKIDFGGAYKNYVSDHTSRVETESKVGIHGVKETKIETGMNGSVLEKEGGDNGLFVFGRNSKQNLSFGESVVSNRTDEVNSSREAFENSNRMANCDSTVNDSCHQESTSYAYHVFSLQDEIKKLNVNDLKNVDDKKKPEMDGAAFVFRSSNGASTSSNGYPKTIYARKKKGLAKFTTKSDGSNRFKFGGKNQLVESADDSVGISNSESFTFQVGTGKSSAECQSFQGRVNDCTPPNGGAMNSNLPEVSSSEAPAVPSFRKENDACSDGSTPGPSGVSFSDLEPPKWDPSSLKSSLFPDLDKKIDFGVKNKSKRDNKSMKTRGKLKKALPKKEQRDNHHVDTERSAKDFQDSPGCYSPMDFSPYEESTAAEELSREIPGTSKDPAHLDGNRMASDSHPISEDSSKDEGTFDFNEEKVKSGVPNDDSCGNNGGIFSAGGYHSKEFVFGAEIPSSDFKNDQVFHQSSVGDAAASSGFDDIHGTQFFSNSGLEDQDAMKFVFSASSSLQDNPLLSLRRRLSVKKNRRKAPSVSFTFAPGPNAKGEEGDLFTSQGNMGHKFEANGKAKIYSAPSAVTIQDMCETWRLRGNHAYKSGDMMKAEDCYTRGIDSVPSDGMLECCLQPLVICYSNRAATRMSLGNIREALSDCMRAASLDPAFLKVQMRAANCHLVLGELESAMHFFNKCLESGPVVLDRRITIEAADGLQKIQKVAECTKHSAELLEDKASQAALTAFEMIVEALSISPHSERLLELKAKSIFVLRKYEEVIHLCEETLSAAEKNFPAVSPDNRVDNTVGSQGQSYSFAKLWRWRLISKSYFCLGKLEVALDFIQKLQQMASMSDEHVKKIFESSVSLAVTICDLLRHKNAGNEAVKSGKYLEAVEHYTAAFTSNIESRPFIAICFCNRAAAHQALGQLADAISDCSLAMAFDRNYAKAVSRRATLHEMIRDYGQAASDLQRLISILEKQSNGKAAHSDTPARSISVSKELRQARKRLSLMEEEAKKGIPLDLYLILGIKKSDATADIKKAYRKAALRHHPDKAGQFLARGESGELWKEIFEEVYTDADRLFKMIGEAYAVLSDNTKRTEYDQDEEIRKESKKNNGYRSQRRTSDAYGNPFDFDRPDDRLQNYWKTYGYSRSRW